LARESVYLSTEGAVLMNSIRRVSVLAAVAVLAVTVLAGCSSSTDSTPSSAAGSTSESVGMLPPVIINVDETAATAKVGDFIDILTSDNDIAGISVSTDKPELVELTQARDDGSAIFNPGGKALAAGTAIITVTNPDGTTRDITLTITE